MCQKKTAFQLTHSGGKILKKPNENNLYYCLLSLLMRKDELMTQYYFSGNKTGTKKIHIFHIIFLTY